MRKYRALKKSKTTSKNTHGPATRAIHGGLSPDPYAGAVMQPIYQTSTYALKELGQYTEGYDYGRTNNPTRAALERNLASLEEAKHAVAFSSGMAAMQALTCLLKTGDHIIASETLYGGVYRYFTFILADFGVTVSWVATQDLKSVKDALQTNTRLIHLETPTNPMLTVSDIAAIAKLKPKACYFSVDNTFMTPLFQSPLKLGADVVLHSATKYLGGHSDVISGCLMTDDDKIFERLRFTQKSVGAVPSPLDCFLVMRGIKTLPLRMAQHEKNGRLVAAALVKAGLNVIYPGLKKHPGHRVAKKQQRGFGAMISFDLGSYKKAKRFLDRLELFTLAESLGGVESLACHPASMTHASFPPARRKELGVSDGLVRLSVGCEDAPDLIADLLQALR